MSHADIFYMYWLMPDLNFFFSWTILTQYVFEQISIPKWYKQERNLLWTPQSRKDIRRAFPHGSPWTQWQWRSWYSPGFPAPIHTVGCLYNCHLSDCNQEMWWRQTWSYHCVCVSRTLQRYLVWFIFSSSIAKGHQRLFVGSNLLHFPQLYCCSLEFFHSTHRNG